MSAVDMLMGWVRVCLLPRQVVSVGSVCTLNIYTDAHINSFFTYSAAEKLRATSSSTQNTWRVSKRQLSDSKRDSLYVLWCLSFQRGVGIFSTGMRRRRCSTGNNTRLLNWTFLFMIAASPLWIHPSSGAGRERLPRGNNRKKMGFITEREHQETPVPPPCLLRAYCIIQWFKTCGGLWGHYTKITEKALRPSWGREGRLKNKLWCRFTRFHPAVSNPEEI